MSNRISSHLILIGHKCCGKTYFGNLLSLETKITHIDTDDLLENLYATNFQEELTCKEIYMKMGRKKFRDLEKSCIDSLLGIESAIISLGGGALLNKTNQLTLKAIGKLVYLELDKNILKERILMNERPAFFHMGDLAGSFERMYRDRTPLYEQASDIKIQMDRKNSKEILEELKSIYSRLNLNDYTSQLFDIHSFHEF